MLECRGCVIVVGFARTPRYYTQNDRVHALAQHNKVDNDCANNQHTWTDQARVKTNIAYKSVNDIIRAAILTIVFLEGKRVIFVVLRRVNDELASVERD